MELSRTNGGLFLVFIARSQALLISPEKIIETLIYKLSSQLGLLISSE